MRTVLESNLGFGADLDRWLPYAEAHRFKHQDALPITHCPDCGASPIRALGRYISFSTLMQLQECACGLLFANARVDPASRAWHFDRAYLDDQYYATDRAAVFAQLTALVAERAPSFGTVLDIGGAGGQFADVLRHRRPDLRITVQDVSAAKVAQAEARGFRGLLGTAWMDETTPYDVIVASDSVYYEPDLPRLWAALHRLRRGTLILRGPNRVPVVKAMSRWQRYSSRLPDDIAGHNPDHLVICTRAYVTQRLRGLGCANVRWLPTPVGEGRKAAIVDRAVVWAHRLSGLILSPSVVVVAR